MKISAILLLLFSISQSAYSEILNERSSRVKQTINEAWFFYPNEIINDDYESIPDSLWEKINLPHTWNAEDSFIKLKDYKRGIGWYKKELQLPHGLSDKKIYLFFEGANQTADVFINGRNAGTHIGGYTAFILDVTDLVLFDKKNIIAVKVDNSHDPDIPPLNADFNFYGGIYRDVWLIAAHKIHIDLLNYASPGVFISAKNVSEASAEIYIEGKVTNDNSTEKNIRIINRVIDKKNNEVFSKISNLTLAGNDSHEFIHSDLISNPNLWSPDDPYLYKVITEVYEDETLVDEVINPLGIRWFEMVEGEGMYLNGKPIKLFGTNRHQDYPQLGNALTDDYHRKDIEIIKENGFNFLRLAHYPQDPAFLSAADEKGLILWEEIPVVNLISVSENFNENSKEMLIEMIRQHYNHPSIFIWGYMNEVLLVKPKPMPEGYVDAVVELALELNQKTREEDPNRLTAIAYSNGEIDDGSGMEAIPDIVGMNLYFGWYYNDLNTFGEFLDSYHKKFPDRNIIISEYGAGSDERIHTLTPKSFDFSVEYQQLFHEETFRQIKERKYLVGSAIWNQFDFGSNRRQDSKNGINQKGIYFFNREPKDISFFYKANLLDDHLIYIASREWQIRTRSNKSEFLPVKIYSNLKEAELFLNGGSLGEKSIKNYTAVWDVPFSAGMNGIVVKKGNISDQLNIECIDRSIDNKFIAVNCGSHYLFIDNSGVVWENDMRDDNNSWGYKNGAPFKTQHSIYNTDDDPLYQTGLENADEYLFDAEDGAYEITLRFCEIKINNPGERIFDVEINDQQMISNLDLYEQYGKFYPVEKKLIINVKKNEGISIKFLPQKGEPIINGVSIKKL